MVLALVLGAASPSAAQAPVRAATAPAAPGSYVETIADGAWVSAESLDGGFVGARSRGGYALHEALELGGGWGWRAAWLSGSGGLGALARAGLVPWTVWVGTGATWAEGGFGARLAASVGPRLAGDAQLDAGGEAWSLGLALAVAHAWPFLEARLDADVAWLNRDAPSVAFGASLSGVIGDAGAPARPLVELELRGSNDLGLSPRLHLGAWILLERGLGLRVAAFASLPDDREGFRLGLEVTVFVWSGPPTARPDCGADPHRECEAGAPR